MPSSPVGCAQAATKSVAIVSLLQPLSADLRRQVFSLARNASLAHFGLIDNRRMLYLKCTAMVQKALGLPRTHLTDALPSEAPLGNWYVNQFVLGRRTAYLFMSEPTLLSFILLQGAKPVTVETLPQMLIGGVEQLLAMGGLGEDAIKLALAHYHTGAFAKTASRSDLGSLNDLMLRYQWGIERDGGLAQCDLTRIIMGTNDMPQRRLGWCSSWEVTRSKLQLPN